MKKIAKQRFTRLLATVLLMSMLAAMLPAGMLTALAAGNEDPGWDALLGGFNLLGGKPFLRSNLTNTIISSDGKASLKTLLAQEYSGGAKQEYSYAAARSIQSLLTSMGVETNSSYSIDASAGYGELIKVNAGYSLSQSMAKESSAYAAQDAFFSMLQVRKTLGTNKITNAGNKLRNNQDAVWNSLSADFKSMLLNANTAPQIDDLFNNYGTHILTSYAIGGWAEFTLTSITDDTKLSSSTKTAKEEAITAGVSGGFAGFSASTDVSTSWGKSESLASELSKSNTNTKAYSIAYGGTAASGNDALNSSQIASWLNSVTSASGSSELVVNDNLQMLGIWELIPDEYAALRESIKKRFFERVEEADKNFLNNYIYATPAVQSFPQPDVNGYTYVSTPAEMAAVSSSGKYILTNDIDMSSYTNWTPINFSGTFDGNGNTISGVSVSTSAAYPGLFGTNTGTIKNLQVTYTTRFGGVAGNNTTGTVKDCYASFQMPSSFAATYTATNLPTTITASTVLIDLSNAASTAINKSITLGENVKTAVFKGDSQNMYTDLIIEVLGNYTEVVFENFKLKVNNGYNPIIFGKNIRSAGFPAVISIGTSTNELYSTENGGSCIYSYKDLYICGTQNLTLTSDALTWDAYPYSGMTAEGNLTVAIDAVLTSLGGKGKDGSTFENGFKGGYGMSVFEVLYVLNNSSLIVTGGSGGKGGYGGSYSYTKGGDSGTPMRAEALSAGSSRIQVSSSAYMKLVSNAPGAAYSNSFGYTAGSFPSFGVYESMSTKIGTTKVYESKTKHSHTHPMWDNGNNALSVAKAGSGLTFVQGTTFDGAGLTLLFGSGKSNVTKSVTYSYDFSKVGKTSVAATYWNSGRQYVRYIPVTVIAPTVTSVTFNAPLTREFVKGTAFSTDGMSLAVQSSDGKIKLITDGFNITGTNGITNEVGNGKTITVTHPSYTGTWKFTVDVIPVAVSKIEITAMPSKNEFYEGEGFTPDGAVFTVTFTDETTKTTGSGADQIPLDSITFNPPTDTVFEGPENGQASVLRTVTASYGGKSCTFNVTVKANPITSLEVVPAMDEFGESHVKTDYIAGEYFSLNGYVIRGLRQYFGMEVELTANDVRITPNRALAVGDTKVTLYHKIYSSASADIPVTVEPIKKVGIQIITLPDKLTYKEGESLNMTGMTVSAVYNNGALKTLTANEYTFSPTVFGQYDTVVTVTELATGATDTFTVALEQKPRYTVGFNANGGINPPESVTASEGEMVVLPGDAPSRNGYSFVGWSVTSNSTAADYTSGDSFRLDADITLYAVWKSTGQVSDGSDTVVKDPDSGGVTTITSEEVSVALAAAIEGSEVIRIVSANADAVTIPAESVMAMTDAGVSLELKTNTAEITFPIDALRTLGGSGAVTIRAEINTALPSIGGVDITKSIELTINDKSYHDFGDAVTVKLPYTLPAGKSASQVVVYYVPESGVPEKISSSYSNDYVTFKTTHFSEYSVGINESMVIRVGNAQGLPGGTVTVPVSIVNNPGFWGFNLTLNSSDGLTLMDIQKGDFDGSLITNDNVILLNQIISETVDPVNFTGDGVLFYATFEISASETVGAEYIVSVILTDTEETNFINTDGAAVACTFENGIISVNKSQPTNDCLDFTLPATVTYSGSPQAVRVMKTNDKIGSFTLYYTGMGGTTYTKSATAPTNAGTYTVTAQIAESTAYSAATLTLGTLTIIPQELTIEWPSVAAQQSAGKLLSEITLTGGSTEYGTFAWSVPDQTVGNTNAYYAVTFTPKAEYNNANYSFPTTGSVSVSVGVTGTPGIGDLVIVYAGNLVYDGGGKAVTVTARGTGMGAITVYYEGVGSTSYAKSTTPPVNAGRYKISVDIAAGSLFGAVTLDLGELVIAKQQIAIPWPSLTTTYEKNTTLGEIIFADCAYGSFAWAEDGTNVITISGNHKVVFTPNEFYPESNYDFGTKTHNVYVTVDSDKLKGDGDGDSTITLVDINMLAKLIARLNVTHSDGSYLTQNDKNAFDMNDDGVFTVVDLLLLAKKFVGLA